MSETITRGAWTVTFEAPSLERYEYVPSYTAQERERARKAYAAALKPKCPDCGSTAANHKRGTPACKRARLRYLTKGPMPVGTTLPRATGMHTPNALWDRTRRAYELDMRVKRGEYVWTPDPAPRWPGDGSYVQVKQLEQAA